MDSVQNNKLFTWQTWVFLFLVFILAFFTYFFRYSEPSHAFWDENYHIASAQKYLNGIYFMEQHPPLGKLLIALGQKIFFPNGQTGKDGFYDDRFINTDHASDFPEDFSFAGYRFFSALLGWLTAPLLFLVLIYITRKSSFALILSFLYIFDNALIVHLRGAMLEGPLIFFTVLMILIYFLLLEYGNKCKPFYFVLLSLFFGASFGLIAVTKVWGFAMFLLLPVYLFWLLPNWKKIIKVIVLFLVGFLIVYVSIWQIHFTIGKKIESALSDDGYYKASAQYKQIISDGTSGNVLNFPVMLRDSLKFVFSYNNGVPKLNLCNYKDGKIINEDGSPFYLWPLGARSISYRWDTPDGKSYSYLYLQSNPVVWFCSFFALLFGCCMLVSSWFFELRLKHRYLLTVFLGIYASYMIAFSFITRVLYLYSYFIPLILSFIVLSIVFMELHQIGKWKLTDRAKTITLVIFACLIVVSFLFYSPLTYHMPLTDKQFKMRNIFPLWGLKCANCNPVNILGIPVN